MADELYIVLQHLSGSNMLDQQLVCNLLQVSKSVRQIILSRDGILVQLRFKANAHKQTQSFCAWIVKCAHLLGSLDIVINPRQPHRSLLQEQVAMAFLVALKRLHIRSYRSNNAAEGIVDMLPGTSLTSLDLSGPPVLSQQCSVGISRLSNLQMLGLRPQRRLPLVSLQQLGRLTHLELHGVHKAEQISALPTQLRVLKITFDLDAQTGVDAAAAGDAACSTSVLLRTGTMQLSHLTALTTLYIPQLTITAGCALPTCLARLTAKECNSVQPLLELHLLQQLKTDMSGIAVDHLVQLSQLRQLADIKLSYSHVKLVSAAPAWPRLTVSGPSGLQSSSLAGAALGPQTHVATITNQSGSLRAIRSLELTCCTVCKDTVAALASLHQLTRLASSACHFQVTVRDVANLIRQLPLLEDLSLLQPGWSAPFALGVHVAGLLCDNGSLVLAAGTLPRLRKLAMNGVSLSNSPAAVWRTIAGLTAATGLVSLSLKACQLTDIIVNSVAWSLNGLTTLNVQSNSSVSRAVLPVISERLLNLRELHIDTQVLKGDGVADYKALQQQLPELKVSTPRGSAVAEDQHFGGIDVDAALW